MMSAQIRVDENHIEVLSETLEIHLTPEIVKRMDEAVRILGLESKEELVRCTIHNMWTDIEWMDDMVNIRDQVAKPSIVETNTG